MSKNWVADWMSKNYEHNGGVDYFSLVKFDEFRGSLVRRIKKIKPRLTQQDDDLDNGFESGMRYAVDKIVKILRGEK